MAIVNPRRTHTYLVTTGDAKGTLAEGIGCNVLLTNQSSLPNPTDRKRWRQVMAAFDDLRIGWMRIGIIPTAGDGAWDDRKQMWNFAHPHFKTLTAIGKWAATNGVRLMFDPFAIPDSFRTKGTYFCDDPHDVARKLILPLAKRFEQQKLPFRYLGLLNERIWGPDKEGFPAIKEFYNLYKGVRDALDEAGITADRLGLLGPSNLSGWEWPIADFFAAGLDPDPLWVGYDQHLYLYNFDWTPENHPDFTRLSELTEGHLRRYVDYAHKRQKPMFVTELGNFYCGRLFWGERDFDGPASHTSVLMDAELIVRGLNEGVDGFLRWAFSVKGDCDGRWSFLENTSDGMTPTANVYPMYRLLMRAIRPNATRLASSTNAAEGAFRYVFSAAVANPDGNACLLIINDLPGKTLNVGLQLGKPFRGKKLYRTVVDETRKGASLAQVAINREGEGTCMLTPSSLTVLSTKPLG